MLKKDLMPAVEWDARNWGRALSFWFSAASVDLSKAECLEIGGRDGMLARFLASQGASVLCIDRVWDGNRSLSFPMAGEVAITRCDLFDIPSDFKCDLVVFKSVLGAIGGRGGYEAQADAINKIYDVLLPGGELWFAENLSASPLHRFFRKRFVPWADRWRYPTLEEIDSLLSGFPFKKLYTLGFMGALGRREKQRLVLGAVDSLIDSWAIPRNWRYIVSGVARVAKD